MLQPLHDLPYRNRFLTLLTMVLGAFGLVLMMLFTVLEAERGPPSKHPRLLVVRAALRAGRLLDTFSDGMYAHILWEKVRDCVAFLLGFSGAFLLGL